MHWWWLGVVVGAVAVGYGITRLARGRVMDCVGAVAYQAYRQIRRIVVLFVGTTVVVVGIIMLVTPGPAVVVIPLGLLILSTEFVWAKRLLTKVKEKITETAKSVTGNGEPTPPQA